MSDILQKTFSNQFGLIEIFAYNFLEICSKMYNLQKFIIGLHNGWTGRRPFLQQSNLFGKYAA